MNFTTHVMFGILIGAIFFGKPEIILLVGLGSAIPDLDREYGFFKRDSFRDHQIHRALFHNYIFLGIIYLINPFLALGAFLHTFLDALTTAKDRGVEWLYPFSRLVKKAVYDVEGKKMELDTKQKIYFYQNDPLKLVSKADADLKEVKQSPWRRTYGPAQSGRLLDDGIFAGSALLTLLLLLFSSLGLHRFIAYSPRGFDPAFTLPFLIGAAGIFLQLIVGEIDRRRELYKLERPMKWYKPLFYVSFIIMFFAISLAGYLNPQSVYTTLMEIPYIIAGIAVVALSAFITFKVYEIKTFRRKDKGTQREPIIV
jgi:hypothetical protein